MNQYFCKIIYNLKIILERNKYDINIIKNVLTLEQWLL